MQVFGYGIKTCQVFGSSLSLKWVWKAIDQTQEKSFPSTKKLLGTGVLHCDHVHIWHECIVTDIRDANNMS